MMHGCPNPKCWNLTDDAVCPLCGTVTWLAVCRNCLSMKVNGAAGGNVIVCEDCGEITVDPSLMEERAFQHG